MTVEEKLKHFLDTSVENARIQSETTIKEYTEVLQRDLQEFKNRTNIQAEEKIKLEETRIRRDMNHDLSVKLLSVKKELSDKHDELKNALFNEVQEMLDHFRKSSEYHELLKKQIRDALSFAGDDIVTVYIDPADASLKDALSDEFHCDIVISDYTFGGGTRTVIEEKNILIDHSFDTRFHELEEDFAFNGGSSNE